MEPIVSMTTGMTLIEAMKALGNIESKIQSKKEKIAKYCATLDSEKLPFETDEKQKAEVESLIQSCEDLESYSRKLKMRVEYTNLLTKVEIKGKMYSISELLYMMRKNIVLMLGVYSTLNDNHARMRLKAFTIEAGKTIQINTHFKEKFKNEKMDYWQSMKESIEGRLEVVNATTQLLELPE